ncbi:hypothetical protein VNO77_34825 [Canavalia gladiata]|uniref:DUF7950 domain-containing protein n=1 Tax=Canavalia gladiata TaxID=3824 RepID=A0AAN9KGX3_CANGL
MLRFRPILPKPPAEGALSVANQNGVVSKRRTKRKYVRVRRNSKSPKQETSEDVAALETLQLMPEKDAPEREVSRCKSDGLDLEKTRVVDNPEPEKAVVETWVTVESVTSTCMGEGGLGCTDGEKVKGLENDTCPGFVCDGRLRVRWVNDAYKTMVVSEERDPRVENVVVWLRVKDSAAAWWCYAHPAFTCGVRLQYTWRNEKCTKLVPCDVWRLDCGGFAWRLDVKAALGLGL